MFMDTKKLLGPYCKDIDYIKINDVEYNRTLETIQSVSYDVNEKLIVTKGKDGATYKGVNYPTTPSAVQDVSGAGDTFLAGLVTGYLRNKSIEKAIPEANELASKAVTLRGVASNLK